MADINVQMPSENEDFDATTGAVEQPVASTSTDFNAPAAQEVAPAAPAEEAIPTAAAPEVAPAAPVVPKVRRSLPVWKIATVVLALLVVGLGVYAAKLSGDKSALQTKLDAANANPQLLVQKQTDELIANVGKLMTLPKDETPTVANVSDAAKAKQQSAFFNNAQNGDRVLMYVKAGEAILYRPSTNKIILVAPLTFNNSTAAPAAATPTKK